MMQFFKWLDIELESNPLLIAFIDLDGCMTDGTALYDGTKIARSYSLQDGHAINYAKNRGILPIVISSSPLTPDIEQRLWWLEINGIFDCVDKANNKFVLDLIERYPTSHIGDDLNDLELLQKVDYPFIPKNCNPQLGIKLGINKMPYLKKLTTLSSYGGNGAVRDYMYKLVEIANKLN